MNARMLFCLALLGWACGHAPDQRNQEVPLEEDLFFGGKKISFIEDRRLEEASGLESSETNPGMLWSHNDSGDEARIFLVDTSGVIVLEVKLAGIESFDWEDMTLGNGFIYIADIGDNEAVRKEVYIHRIAEPVFDGADTLTVPKEQVATMTIQYEEGPRDAETLLFDPVNEQLLIVTKREANCLVYGFPFQDSTGPIRLKSAGTLPLTKFTAGDIHTNGEILLKNYEAVFYWETGEEPAIHRILEGPAYRIPYAVEPQGEAICWSPGGSFFTLSEFNENTRQFIYYYRRLD